MFGALLTDLSKAFYCLDHELLIAKLNAYGFNLPVLRLITYQMENKERKSIIIIVFGQKYYRSNFFLPTIVFYRRNFILGPENEEDQE